MRTLLLSSFLFIFCHIGYAQYQPTQLIGLNQQTRDIAYKLEADGDWGITSAYNDSVYVLHKDTNGNWDIVHIIPSPDTLENFGFGASIAISGDLILVGSPYIDVDTVVNIGKAYLYQKDEGGLNNWGLVSEFVSEHIHDHHERKQVFGKSVAIDQDRLIISDLNGAVDSLEAVSVYERNAGGTNQWGKVTELAPAEPDFWVGKLIIQENTIVIGDETDKAIPGLDDRVGAAYVYDYDQNSATWSLAKKIPAPGRGSGSTTFFSREMDIDGDALVIGSFKYNNYGAAFVYERDHGGTNNWGYLGPLLLPFECAEGFMNFGHDVAISENRILVGAEAGGEGYYGRTGTAFLYKKNELTGAWDFLEPIKPANISSGDRFGYQVHLEEEDILISAIAYNDYDGAIFALKPTAYIESSGTLCSGEDIDLTFHFPKESTGPYAVSYQSGTTVFTLNDIEEGHVVTINPTSNQFYELLWAKDGEGNELQKGLGTAIFVHEYPNATLSAPSIGCLGDSIELKLKFYFPEDAPLIEIVFSRFNAVLTDGSQDYFLNGVGRNSTLKLPFTKTTAYWIKSATNRAGCTRTAGFLSGKKQVRAVERPVASFSTEGDQACLGTTVKVQFTGDAEANSYYLWHFGPSGRGSYDDNFSYTYHQADTHTIRLIVREPSGCQDTATYEAEIYPAPYASFSLAPQCEGNTSEVAFSGNASANSVFSWQVNGDVLAATEEPNLIYKFEDSGNQNVKLVVTNPFGCADTVEKTLSIYDNPPAYVSQNAFDRVKLIASQHSQGHQWYKDGEAIAESLGGTARFYTATEVGDYYYEGFNERMCSSISNTIVIDDIVLGLFSEKQSTQALKIWPNPSNSGEGVLVEIPSTLTSEFSVNIITISGQQLLSETYPRQAAKSQLSLNALPPLATGIYLVQVIGNDQVWQTKLVVK